MYDNTADYARRYTEFINTKNIDVAAEFYSQDIIFHDVLVPNGVIHGLDGMRQFLGGLFIAFSDLHFVAEGTWGEGERIAWLGTMRGTMTGNLGEIPSTGLSMTSPIAEFYQMANGKIQEAWIFVDSLGVWQQLGLVGRDGSS